MITRQAIGVVRDDATHGVCYGRTRQADARSFSKGLSEYRRHSSGKVRVVDMLTLYRPALPPEVMISPPQLHRRQSFDAQAQAVLIAHGVLAPEP